MPNTLDFWFDYSCPYAYLASTQVDALAKRMGATLTLEPMLLGGVFKANGTAQNMMASLAPAKAKHNVRDMHRWAAHFGVPLRVPEEHPMRTVEALRATLATAIDPKVVHGFFKAYWVDGRAPSDAKTMRDVLGAAGYDADTILARIEEPALKDDLRARTDRAIALGIFGAPSFVVDGAKMYWGQDRMELVAGTPWAPPPNATPSGTPTKHTLDFYWDFSSPFAYLASTQVEALAARTGATLRMKPMLLGGVFRSIGQVDVPLSAASPAKQRYLFEDMGRWAAYWGTPFRFPSRFPMNSVKALRTYLALPEPRRAAFREAAFRAYWAEDRDISSDAVLAELVGEGASDVLAKTQTPAIKQELIAASHSAVDAGVFGAPTFVIDGEELYWGQDRLPLVERALSK